MRQAGELGNDENTPRSQRDHLEHAEEIVDGRVVGPLLVSVVQPVDAGEQNPERKAQEEEHDLPPRLDLVDGRPGPPTPDARMNAVVSPATSATRSKRRISHPRRRKRSAEAAWLVW